MNETLLTVGFAILFFALIMASVALHEIGHMVPAKVFGVKVPQYFVGFGPTLWSTKRGETEYGLKWIPLGGYVRLLGMYPPGSRREGKPSRLAEWADAARAYEWDEITPEDQANGRLFYQKKTWQKLIVMAGGPLMNILIAFLLFSAITGLHGVYRPQTTIHSIQDCIIRDVRQDMTCKATDPVSPAKRAGLAAGDRIVEFNGVRITDYDQLTDLIRANLDREARITVDRGGREVPLAPVNTVIDGVPDKLDPSKRIAAGWLGIRPDQVLTRGGPDVVIADMWEMSLQSGTALVQFPVKVFNVVADLVSGRPRDVNGPMSILGASRAAGEVAANEQLSVTDKAVMFASLLGAVNLFLALFNFVPLPPLDGGHIAGALYEAARRRIAGLLKKPDPGYFDTARMLPVAYGVGAFLLLCGVALILADILSPIKIF